MFAADQAEVTMAFVLIRSLPIVQKRSAKIQKRQNSIRQTMLLNF